MTEPLIRAVQMPDAVESGDPSARPRWERANMPKGEWERALMANDAEVAKAQPGSPDFSRLMQVRVNLHFPPPRGVSLADIDAYKQAQFTRARGKEIDLELRRASDSPRWQTIALALVSVVSLLTIGYFAWTLGRH